MYAIRPILVSGKVVPEGAPFDPVSAQHGKELVAAGLASETPPDGRRSTKAPANTPAKTKAKSAAK